MFRVKDLGNMQEKRAELEDRQTGGKRGLIHSRYRLAKNPNKKRNKVSYIAGETLRGVGRTEVASKRE
jgi:hypothetical protein